MAFYDYSDPVIAEQAASVTMSVIGGAILVVSVALFLIVLARGQAAVRTEPGGVPAQRRRASAAFVARGAERLRTLAQPDDRADHRELWLPDCAPSGDARYCGSGRYEPGLTVNRNWIAYVRDRWFAVSVSITAGLAVAGAVVGFAWLPFEQPGQEFHGLWDAICSAAGLIRILPGHEQVIQADYPITQFEVTSRMRFAVRARTSIGRGATLALRCSMCHGARGLSQANSPNLAGQ